MTESTIVITRGPSAYDPMDMVALAVVFSDSHSAKFCTKIEWVGWRHLRDYFWVVYLRLLILAIRHWTKNVTADGKLLK